MGPGDLYLHPGRRHLNGASLTERLGMDPAKAKALFGTEAVTRPEAYEGKGAATAWFESFKAWWNLSDLCHDTTFWIDLELLGLEEMAALMEKATGQQSNAGGLARRGRTD